VKAGSLFGFALGGQIQSQSGLDCLDNHKHTIIAGRNKTQVQQKRYRYTGKERDDSSGLCHYGARYLAPWLARWINPDSAGVVDGLKWVPICRVLLCCFAWLVEMSSEGR
jgi:RHS repeat-associated protein